MIKLPKEVNQVLKKLEAAGFEAFTAGACVRDSMMGSTPLDWDIVTSAGIQELKKLIPGADILSEENSIVRIDKTQGGDENAVILDISTFRRGTGAEGPLFCHSIEEDLAGRHFTIDAMADNPARPLKDPYKGREDIKARLVRTIGDPAEAFEQDPILMLEAILLAAELDFDLPKDVYEAMVAKSALLGQADVGARRELFADIIVARHAGKGLRMLAGAELMPALVGDIALKLSARERGLFSDLADGIDKLKPVVERRLGLFYMCFEKKGLWAIEKLKYDTKTHQHLTDAMTQMTKIYFLANKTELKNYIYNVGMERYDYLQNLAKAHKIVYPQGNVKVENRHYMMEEIVKNNEPIFLEDLAITRQDIIDAGIADDEKADRLLQLLPALVHRKPNLNQKEDLLKHARKFSKNKLKAAFRGVEWLK